VKSSRAALAGFLAASTAAAALAADAPLPRTELRSGPYAFDVEVASTPAQRARGLMGRTRLAGDAGMLFVFEAAERHCFWMKDTPLALSIAFLADDGTIVGTADMQPQTNDLHCAAGPVRYALEVKRSGLESRGLLTGARITGGPFEPPVRHRMKE
jgi:uncharacterized membrane protein (UPF0127 family)